MSPVMRNRGRTCSIFQAIARIKFLWWFVTFISGHIQLRDGFKWVLTSTQSFKLKESLAAKQKTIKIFMCTTLKTDLRITLIALEISIFRPSQTTILIQFTIVARIICQGIISLINCRDRSIRIIIFFIQCDARESHNQSSLKWLHRLPT